MGEFGPILLILTDLQTLQTIVWLSLLMKLLNVKCRVRNMPHLTLCIPNLFFSIVLLTQELAIQSLVVAVKLPLDSEVGANLSQSRQSLHRSLLQGRIESFSSNISQQILVVGQGYARNYRDVAAISLLENACDPPYVAWQ